ncbi:MAG: dehydrogenase, partial [Chitinophagaceae bacterium]
HIDDIYNAALQAGAYSGKISGAGGGGFMMFFVDPLKRLAIKKALIPFGGEFVNFHFFKRGANAWKVQ